MVLRRGLSGLFRSMGDYSMHPGVPGTATMDRVHCTPRAAFRRVPIKYLPTPRTKVFKLPFQPFSKGTPLPLPLSLE